MSRRSSAAQRVIESDLKYPTSTLIPKLVNYTMERGLKNKAREIVYYAINKLSEEYKITPEIAVETVVSNVKPLLEVKSRRVGGATYKVPCEVRYKRAVFLGMSWILSGARKSKKKRGGMKESLLNELRSAYNNSGFAFNKKEELHKTAQANRAFSHFSW